MEFIYTKTVRNASSHKEFVIRIEHAADAFKK